MKIWLLDVAVAALVWAVINTLAGATVARAIITGLIFGVFLASLCAWRGIPSVGTRVFGDRT